MRHVLCFTLLLVGCTPVEKSTTGITGESERTQVSLEDYPLTLPPYPFVDRAVGAEGELIFDVGFTEGKVVSLEFVTHSFDSDPYTLRVQSEAAMRQWKVPHLGVFKTRVVFAYSLDRRFDVGEISYKVTFGVGGLVSRVEIMRGSIE